MTKKCIICGKLFDSYLGIAKSCKGDCRKKYYNQKSKEWVKKNKERRKANWTKYNETHREEVNRRNLENYYKNKDFRLAYQKLPKNKLDNNARTRAKTVMKNAGIEKVCASCGVENNIEIHHIDFNCRNNNLLNLIYLCTTCHGKRHRK